MFYYFIAISLTNRSKADFLTYSHDLDLTDGACVVVSIRSKLHLGFIVRKVTEPTYKTRPIDSILALPPIPPTQLSTLLALAKNNPYCTGQITQLFAPPVKKVYDITKAKDKKPLKNIPSLNAEQQAGLKTLFNNPSPSLLFGETGSGKTRMYTHAVQKVLKSGRSAIICTPEIGLSTLMFNELSQHFENIVHYHSQMTKKQRQIVWQKALLSEKPIVVVGPRSALTLPISNVGLIVLDEAHDNAYKQESSPYLRGHSIALELSRQHKAHYIYASATPLAADLYYAEAKNIPIVRITSLAAQSTDRTNSITIISHDDESEFPKSALLAKSSIQHIKNSIKSGHQSLVLLNKRGSAQSIFCADCGWEYACPRCDHALTYHRDTHKAHCHFCGLTKTIINTCGSCGSYEIQFRVPGTKAMIDYITSAVPGITARRFDTDNSKAESLSMNTEDLTSGAVQCIVGTQMIAKGLDLPRLNTVIVVQAKGSSGGDYASEERAFQLLHQVIGRGVRGHQNSTVILQTHDSRNPTFSFVVNRDTEGFIKSELIERQKFGYPPYTFMAVIHFKRKNSATCQRIAKEFIFKNIGKKSLKITPGVANMRERIGRDYHWHMLVFSKSRAAIVALAEESGPEWSFDLDPIGTP